MKMKMSEMHARRSFKASRLALPLAALLWLPGMLACAQAGGATTEPAGKPSTTAQTAAQCQMSAQCKSMSEMRQKLQTEMKKNDAQLDKLVAAMNQASGKQKIDDIAAVVTKLVAQREQMHKDVLAMRAVRSKLWHQAMEQESTSAGRPSAERSMRHGSGL